MEHNIPQIGFVGRYYFFSGVIAFILIHCSGDRWNELYKLTGIYLSTSEIVILGIIISATFGYWDKVENKVNFWVIIIYITGFLFGLFIVYVFFNKLTFKSIGENFVKVLMIVAFLPGFGLFKWFQSVYNRKLEDQYWKDYENQQET